MINEAEELPCETLVTRFTVRCGGSEVSFYVRYNGVESEYSLPHKAGNGGWKFYNSYQEANNAATVLARRNELERRSRDGAASAGRHTVVPRIKDGGIN